MRIKIKINSIKEQISIKKSYNHLMQGFIYNLLDKYLSRKLHDQGYMFEKRKFKLFTFSRLMGDFFIKENNIVYKNGAEFILSSPKQEILQSLAEGILTKENLFLGNSEIFVESVEVLPEFSLSVIPENDCILKMLSPFTVYSTLEKKDGKKITHYYSPFDKEFETLIKNNLLKKYEIILNKKCSDDNFSIISYKVNKKNEKIVIYEKGSMRFVIKAWMGLYKISGNPELIRIAYDTGIGSKNSMGFGCWEIFG